GSVWHAECGFFFSSRRRHTRFDCDWSSDVCSSDLTAAVGEAVKRCAANRIDATHLAVSHAFHSPDMHGAVQPLKAALDAFAFTRSEERRVGKEWSARRSAPQCKQNKLPGLCGVLQT